MVFGKSKVGIIHVKSLFARPTDLAVSSAKDSFRRQPSSHGVSRRASRVASSSAPFGGNSMYCAGLNTAASVALSFRDGEEQSLTAGQQNLFDLASLRGGARSAEIFFVFHSVSSSSVLSMISCLSSERYVRALIFSQ